MTAMERHWDLTPHSRATNSYELINELIELVRAEPKRLYMENFILSVVPDVNEDITRGPACGTIGCFSGWLHTMTLTKRKFEKELHYPWRDETEYETYLLFPEVTRVDVSGLFWGNNSMNHNKAVGKYPFPTQDQYGTPAYAKAAISNLKRFQDEWEEELKAYKLVPPTIV
jgi:hypothetical protein